MTIEQDGVYLMSRSRKTPSNLADDWGAEVVARRIKPPVGATMITSSLSLRLGKGTPTLRLLSPTDNGPISALSVVPSKLNMTL